MFSNDGWGKGWPVDISKPWPEDWVEEHAADQTKMNEWFKSQPDMMAVKFGIDTATKPDRLTAIIGHMKDGQLVITQHLEGDEARAIIDKYNNQVPTHDPYTNPDMHIYHECACGAILDPNTKSFATLNTAASQVGWKIRWGVHTYRAYCFECGKDVE